MNGWPKTKKKKPPAKTIDCADAPVKGMRITVANSYGGFSAPGVGFHITFPVDTAPERIRSGVEFAFSKTKTVNWKNDTFGDREPVERVYRVWYRRDKKTGAPLDPAKDDSCDGSYIWKPAEGLRREFLKVERDGKLKWISGDMDSDL